MTILENDYLKISVRNQGAELTSVIHKKTSIEYLWQANPAIWNWHGPNLFPVVGGCFNNEIHINGRPYRMERHGFARQSEFRLIDSSAAHALFSLESSEQTMAVYPYRFEFQIAYTLAKQLLTITYRVINKDNQPVYFSVGAHPAFNVPFLPNERYSDYYLEFVQQENLERHLLSENGLFNGKTEPVLLDDQKLWLTKDLFNQDALVFKNLVSEQVTLCSKNHDHFISVTYPSFPYLGIWAKPGASFVCIEPWLGCADTEGQQVAIQGKEAIQSVASGAVFETSFSIDIH